MTINLTYQLEDGERIPLYEAEYDMSFKVYRSDRSKAIIGDPRQCIEAKGVCRLPNVLDAYIGSGKDAYVIFAPNRQRKHKHAIHFVIPVSSARVRDAFEIGRNIKSQILLLKAPSNGTTLVHRRKLNARRREEIKNGSPVKKRETLSVTRIQRLGVRHRPKAHIKHGVVSLD